MWLDGYQWISGSPQRRHIATTTDGSEEVIVRGGEDVNAIYRESWPEVIPARPRDELAKILDAPSESAEVAPHRSEQGGVGDHRGGVHVRDQRDRECEAVVQAGERQRQRATQAQAHHPDRSLVLGEQPAE